MQLVTTMNAILSAKREPKQAKAEKAYTGFSYKSDGILGNDYKHVSLWEKTTVKVNGKNVSKPVVREDGLQHLNPEAILGNGEDGKALVAHYTSANTHVFRVFHDESDADRGFETVEQAIMYAMGYDLTTLDEDGNEVPLTDAMGNPIHVPGLFETCRGIEFRLLKHPTNGTFFWCDKWHREERDGREPKNDNE